MKDFMKKSATTALAGVIALTSSIQFGMTNDEVDIDAAPSGINITTENVRSSRYNSMHRGSRGRFKAYRGRMFKPVVNGVWHYCIEPFADLPYPTAVNPDGSKKSLAAAISDTEHSSGATRKANNISKFLYYGNNPDKNSGVQKAIRDHGISRQDIHVANQYYIWEALGLTMVDDEWGAYDPSGTGLGNVLEEGKDMIWVPPVDIPGSAESESFTLDPSYPPSLVKSLGATRGNGDIVNISGAIDEGGGFMDTVYGSGKIPKGGTGTITVSSTTSTVTFPVKVKSNYTPPGAGSSIPGYWKPGPGKVVEKFYQPPWYKAYKQAVLNAINADESMPDPVLNKREETVVVGNSATFNRVSGASLNEFFKHNDLPKSRPSSPNFKGHSYVWRSGDTLKIEPTMSSPDEFSFDAFNRTKNNLSDQKAWSFSGVQNLIPTDETTGHVEGAARLNFKVKVLKHGYIDIEKRNRDTNKPVSGAKYSVYSDAAGKNLLKDAEGNSVFTTGSNGKIKTGGFIVDKSGKSTFYVKEVSVPSPLVLDDKLYPVVVNAGQTSSYGIKNKEQLGQITIVKKDKNTGNQLSDSMFDGAQFKVTLKTPHTELGKAGDSQVITMTKGIAKTKADLPLGVYEVEEVKAPYGYVLEKNLVTINNKYTNQTIEVNQHSEDIKNTRQTGQITITKKDKETGKVLKHDMFDGAQFKVTLVKAHTPFGKVGYSETVTIKDGVAKTSDKLDLGLYEISEVKAPFGYILSDEIIDINNKYTNQTVYVNQHSTDYRNDRQKGEIEVFKRDVITGAKPQGDATLAGAKYQLKLVSYKLPSEYIPNAQKPGDVVRQFETDVNGYAKLTDLELGVYDIVEIEPSTGYVKNDAAVRLELLYGGQNVKVSTNVEQRSQNHKHLVDEINGLQSIVNGMITNPTQQMDKKPIRKVEYSEVDNSPVISTNERPIMGRIQLQKVIRDHQEIVGSTQTKPEKGAKFDLILKSTGEVMDTIVTNDKGEGTSKYLPYGIYTLRQTAGEKEYWEVDDIDVFIEKDGEVKFFTLSNQEIETTLRIVKQDSETGKVIPQAGVKFQLFRQKEGGEPIKQIVQYPEIHVIDEWVTNEKGEVTLPRNLEYGTYWLEEQIAPEGYYLDPEGERIEVKLHGEGTLNELTMLVWTEEVPNIPQKGQLELHKEGLMLQGWETEEVEGYDVHKPILEKGYLANAVFELRAAEDIVGKEGTLHYEKGELVEKIVTEKDKVTFSKEVPLGKYTFQEVEAPEGYLRDEKVYELEFTPQHQSIRVQILTESVWNEKQTVEFSFTKDFEESEWFGYEENAWKKAIFGLYNKEEISVNGVKLPADTLVGVTLLDKKGEGETLAYTGGFEATFAGKYYIKELETDEAYVLDETQHELEFEYKPDGKLVEQVVKVDPIENEIIRGEVELYKFDSENVDRGLQNATFELVAKTNEGEKVIGRYISDKAGMIEIKDLEYGAYYIYEVEAPKGYVTDETPIDFEIREDKVVIPLEKENKPTIIEVEKRDFDNPEKPVEHARLGLFDIEGNFIQEWLTTEASHIIKRLVVGEKYMIKEIHPPLGYATAEPIIFEVENTPEHQVIRMLNKLTTVDISKHDATDSKELPGAHLSLWDYEGNLVDEWISTDQPYRVRGLHVGRTYTLREDLAPIGYATASEIQFVIRDTNDVQKVQMFDEPLKVVISKMDMTNGKELPGAHLEIISKETGKVVYEWISTDKPHLIERIPLGDYILRETIAPNGYVTAEEVEFTITDNGVEHMVHMYDDVTKVEISKMDITNGKELPGATLQIIDSEGKVVHEWVSSDKPHYIEKLPVGDYTLRETIAPEGYVTAEEIQFTITDQGLVHQVHMYDDVTKVEISKVDITNGKELPGATLQIISKETGKVIHEWVSGDEPHYIEKLPVGDYYLKETIAPDGYVTSEIVEFTITDQGLVHMVHMYDDVTKVSISKKDITNKEELPGATLQIIDKKTGEIIEEWISTDKPHYIEKLPVGDYYLKEITAPEGYVTAEVVEFTVSDTGVVQIVEMFDDVTKVEISKKDITTKEELPGATLQIIDKETGKVIHEWVSSDKPHYIEKLPVGNYILREITAPNGYLTAEDVEFEITDSGIVHKVEMFDDYTKVAINKVDENGNPLAGAHLQVIDKDGNVLYDWVSDGKAFEIYRLPAGEYTLREVSAPEGYDKAQDMKFTVNSVSEVQEVTLRNTKTPVIQTGDFGHTNLVAPMQALGLGALLVITVLGRKKEEQGA